MWVATAVAVVGMAVGAENSRIQAGASRRAAREQTNQSKAKQEELNSQSELARSIQKVNNDRIMRAADKTYTAAATNLTRNRAAAQTNNVMAQIAQVEAAGAYAANAASKGIGGSSVEVIENTMALRDDLKNRLTKNAQSQADYDAVQTLAGIIPAGWQQQDMTVISGNQSPAAAVPRVEPGFNWVAALADSPALRTGMANLLSPSAAPTGSSGTGLKPGTGGTGFSTPSTGWWSSRTSSIKIP